MATSYGYLIVEQHRYPMEPAEKAGAESTADSTSAGTAGDSFADQLRNALDAAAKSAGYGSLERLMSSVRVLGRSTPSRAEHVRSLVQAGLLKEDAEISQMMSGAVPDPAWALFHQVHPDRGRGQRIPKPPARPASQGARDRVVDSWSLSVHASDGVTSIDIDPARTPGHELPVALIAKSLETLSVEGWAVVHVSEDRAIDDSASTSHVVRQRILLRR